MVWTRLGNSTSVPSGMTYSNCLFKTRLDKCVSSGENAIAPCGRAGFSSMETERETPKFFLWCLAVEHCEFEYEGFEALTALVHEIFRFCVQGCVGGKVAISGFSLTTTSFTNMTKMCTFSADGHWSKLNLKRPLWVLEILCGNTEPRRSLQVNWSMMFSNASIDLHEDAKGEHVANSRLGTTLCPPSFDNLAGVDIMPISRCFSCGDKKHHVATNGLESLLLRADRYSRNLNCEIDYSVCRMALSTGNSIIYQGILRSRGAQVAIKSIVRFRPDSDIVKVNSFDVLSHWLTNHRLANSP